VKTLASDGLSSLSLFAYACRFLSYPRATLERFGELYRILSITAVKVDTVIVQSQETWCCRKTQIDCIGGIGVGMFVTTQ
jgi:hypothetical protein